MDGKKKGLRPEALPSRNRRNLPSFRQVDRDIGPHHLVVFMIEGMAVSDVARSAGIAEAVGGSKRGGGVERVKVLSGIHLTDGKLLGGESKHYPGDLTGPHHPHVFPAEFIWPGRHRRTDQVRAERLGVRVISGGWFCLHAGVKSWESRGRHGGGNIWSAERFPESSEREVDGIHILN